MPPAAFSRVALAAALLEYDNDSEDPNIVKKSAQESALFIHLRKSGPVPQPHRVKEYDDLPEPRRRKDYLRVALPTGGGGDGDGRRGPTTEPVNFGEPPTRPSREGGRRSLDVLREQGEQYFQNPDEAGEEGEGSDEDDVDLQSWGLDSLMPAKATTKDKPSRRAGPAKPRPASEHLDNLPNPHSPQDDDFEPQFNPETRSMSLFGEGSMQEPYVTMYDGPQNRMANTFPLAGRRPDFISPLDEFGQMSVPQLSLPYDDDHDRDQSPGQIDPASVPLPVVRDSFDDEEPEHDDTFAVPLPAGDRLSRFDPKAQAQGQIRSQSRGSWVSHDDLKAMARSAEESEDEEEDADDRDEEDGDGATSRPRSAAPFEGGDQQHLSPRTEADLEDMRRSQHLKIMRPKVLVMPSPLRDQVKPGPPSKVDVARRAEGFLDTTDDRPLPVGFRTSAAVPTLSSRPGPRPLGASQSTGAIHGYNAPSRLSLSASQMLFRDSLMAGGARDSSYATDLENGAHLKRAMVDGEKIEVEENIDPELLEKEYQEYQRPSGKLLGHSLMDALEARKMEIKGKRRVFLGDNRPSMMDRTPSSDATPPATTPNTTVNSNSRANAGKSTLIDPSSFNMPQIAVMDGEGRPIREGDGTGGPNRHPSMLDKRGSTGPLVNLGTITSTGGLGPGASVRGKSVFGTDKLWEKELGRLERIKEAERIAQEEAVREEEERYLKSSTKGKGKGKRRGLPPGAGDTLPSSASVSAGGGGLSSPGTPGTPGFAGSPGIELGPSSNDPNAAPTLPDVAIVSSKGRPRPAPVPEEDEFDEVDENGRFTTGVGRRRPNSRTGTGVNERRRTSEATLGVKGWFADSDDDDEGGSSRARTPLSEIRTPMSTIGASGSGGGRRFAASPSAGAGGRLAPVLDGDEDDEDAPLANRASQLRASMWMAGAGADDSDEDVPLADLKKGKDKEVAPVASTSTGGLTRPRPPANAAKDDDDDDEPLGLRATRLFASNFKLPSPSLQPVATDQMQPVSPVGSAGAGLPSPKPSEKADNEGEGGGASGAPTSGGAADGGSADNDDEDDDDKPLGLKYAGANTVNVNATSQQQQQQAQQQMLAQQQQMYMQQLARNSMANFSSIGGFNPMGMSINGSAPGGPGSMFGPFGSAMGAQMTGGSFGVMNPQMMPGMGMGMGMPMGMGAMGVGVSPMGAPVPVPVVAQPVVNPSDAAKITRVDAWRKGVAEDS